MKIFGTYKIRLKILSSVHIGCGEVYEPVNFIVKDGKLVEFDPLEFIEKLSRK